MLHRIFLKYYIIPCINCFNFFYLGVNYCVWQTFKVKNLLFMHMYFANSITFKKYCIVPIRTFTDQVKVQEMFQKDSEKLTFIINFTSEIFQYVHVGLQSQMGLQSLIVCDN